MHDSRGTDAGGASDRRPGNTTDNASSARPASPSHSVIVRCTTCSTLNRVNLARIGDRPKCSRCANALPLDTPLVATDADFARFIEAATVPVVVDFYADWCGPCKAMAPILENFAKQQAGRTLVLKLDTDRNPVTAERFRIASIPTLVVFRNGREWKRQVGVANREALERMVAN